ncbi:unnamed protein product [Thelazia callipaeda]|uniref:Coiled-coil domain-containing protein 148 n=1 Tax=Thelazia callipaeda TaxID=103827 RepID=A0A0N5CRD4_THECL|nr:unnamed protein product [Thelazia callipaeda]
MPQMMENSRKSRDLRMNLKTEDGFEEDSLQSFKRQKRGIELHDWLTDAQKESIREMEAAGKSKLEIKEKLLEMYHKMPDETRKKWDEFYRKICNAWIENVTTSEERSVLQKLKNEKAIDEYEAKISEYKTRLPAQDKERFELWKDECRQLNKEQESPRHRARRHSWKNSELAQILTNEQIAILEDMQADQASEEDLEKKKNQLVFDTLLEEYFIRLPKEKQEVLRSVKVSLVSYIADICGQMWREKTMTYRQKRSTDKEYDEWITWMSHEQKEELDQMRESGSNFENLHQKINEYFVKLPKKKQIELISTYKSKCRKYFLGLANEEEIAKINATIQDDGSRHEYLKIIESILNRQPTDIKEKADKFYRICDDIYHKKIYQSNLNIEELIEKHLAWLTPEQKTEIKQMKSDGKPLKEIKQKLLLYIKSMGAEKQQHVIKKTKESCYAWLDQVTTAEERSELENMHQTDHSACKKKVREYIKRLPIGKQEEVNKDLTVCEDIWYSEHEHHHEDHHHHKRVRHDVQENDQSSIHGRHRRDHHEHTLEQYLVTYLKWLNEDQKAEIKKMKEEEKPVAEIQAKIFGYLDNLDSDLKCRATESMYYGCRDFVHHIVGDEKYEEIKKMKEANASGDEKIKKVDELFAEVTDEKKREKINKYYEGCKKVFKMMAEQKKHKHYELHNLEHYFKTQLNWLGKEKEDEIRKMHDGNKTRSEIVDKVLEYYEELKGKQKFEVTRTFAHGCRHALKDLIGEEKYGEFNKLPEPMQISSKNFQEMKEKVKKVIAEVSDEKKKARFGHYESFCFKIGENWYSMLEAQLQKRSLEDYFKSDLSWLSDEQKETIIQMRENGTTREEREDKIVEFLEHLQSDSRQKAIALIKGGCFSVWELVLGKEKSEVLKKIHNSKKSTALEVREKFDEFLASVKDERKQEKAKEFGKVCQKAMEYKDKFLNRSLDDYLQNQLKWLSDEQKQELRRMNEEGESKKTITDKIMQFYREIDDSSKKEATEVLKDTCVEIAKYVVGEDKANELESMDKSGKSFAEIQQKLKEFAKEISDEPTKEYLEIYEKGCEEVYRVSRQLEERKQADDVDDKEHSLQSYFKTHLKWLNKEQQDELLGMKNQGKSREEIRLKIFDYIKDAKNDTKELALKSLTVACNEMFKRFGGEERAKEIQELMSSHANSEEVNQKIKELVDLVKDESEKDLAEAYGTACQQLYTIKT